MPGRRLAAGRRKRLEAVEQRIDQRSPAARVVALAGTGVNHHSGRLVHHRQVGVFVDYVQGNIFRSGFERRGMRLAGEHDALAAAQLERGLLALAVHQHIALGHEKLHARAAHAFQLRGQKLIKSLPGGFGGHVDRALCQRSAFRHGWPRCLVGWRFALQQHQGAGQHQHDCTNLRPIERAVQQDAAAFGVAPKLGDINSHAGSHEHRPARSPGCRGIGCQTSRKMERVRNASAA